MVGPFAYPFVRLDHLFALSRLDDPAMAVADGQPKYPPVTAANPLGPDTTSASKRQTGVKAAHPKP